MKPVFCLDNPTLQILLDEQGLPVDDEFVIATRMRWLLSTGDMHTVPAGFITNFASLPKAVRSVLNVNGKSRRAAVLHDDLYCSGQVSRDAADFAFYLALLAEGMTPVGAKVYWSGLRVGGWVTWNKRRKQGGYLQEDFVSRASFERATGVA